MMLKLDSFWGWLRFVAATTGVGLAAYCVFSTDTGLWPMKARLALLGVCIVAGCMISAPAQGTPWRERELAKALRDVIAAAKYALVGTAVLDRAEALLEHTEEEDSK